MVKIGSRVKFLHSTGAGYVRKIVGNMVYVDVDGFEIPAMVSDVVEVAIEAENAAIVRIGPSDNKPQRPAVAVGGNPIKRSSGGRVIPQYGKITLNDDYQDDDPVDIALLKRNYAKTAQAQVQPSAPAPIVKKIEPAPYELTQYDVKLIFVPVGKANVEQADLDAYIVNDSSYDLYYTVALWRKGYVETIRTGCMEADSKELLRRFTRAEVSQIMTMNIGLLPFKPINYVPQAVENFDIELHPLKFVRAGGYTENDFFDEPALIFTLGTTAPCEETIIPELKPKAEDRSRPKEQGGKVSPEIVDLHIESILDNWESLSPGEVLQAQLARFTLTLDGALKLSRRGKMVFIHGVGKGKLKYELKKLLDRNYSKLRYQDASFAEYGYGAIMVFL